MMSVGLEIPETRINKEDPPFMLSHLVLPSVHIQPRIHGAVCIAPIAKGCGFNHDSFSRLYLDEDKANFQLHTWEYLIAEELMGYVVRSLEVWFQDLEVRLQTR